MICNKTIRDGTNQLERISEFLKEGFVQIDERSEEDLIRFIHDFAEKLAYYNLSNDPAGNWQTVLGELSYLQDIQAPKEQNKVPHVGLLIVLTKLYRYAQNEINTITERHLNYYYKEVLKIQPKKAIPDEVQLVLNLAKNNTFDNFLLKGNTDFDAGMDFEKKHLIYKTDKESIISRAEVRQIKTLFLDKEEGLTRIVMAPIADSLDGVGEPLDEDAPFWASFGESQIGKDLKERTMVDASIGFAISSSVLLLREGDRTIDIDINFFPNEGFSGLSSLRNAFIIYYSGEEAWEQPGFHKVVIPEGNPWQLQLKITIDASQSSFDYFDPEIHGDMYPTRSPMLKVILRPEAHGYDILKLLKVDTVDIAVEAKGMKDHLIQNNSGVLNPESPFLPFGPQPALNNRFYIGNVEIFQKKLENLTITLDWHEIPTPDFADHYDEYNLPLGFGNNSFDVRIDLLLNRSWEHRLKAPVPLFNSIDANIPNIINIAQVDFDLATIGEEYVDEPTNDSIRPIEVKTSRGFIRMELITPKTPFKAFGHKEFTPLYTERAIALATYDSGAPGPPPVPVLPNQPYTPNLKGLSLGYQSSKTINSAFQTEEDALFQIGPFGFRSITTSYHPELVPLITEEGSLILGLDSFSPPETLNLLFDLEDGTSERSLILEPENITWSYLSDNRWIQLSPQEVLADGTKGFIQSGIISLVLPKNASDTNDYLPSGLFWIKTTASVAAEGANKLKNIFSNAINATLRLGQENYDTHLSKPLPVESISTLLNRVKEVKKVTQPLQSNKGYPSESPSFYNARISERLRHKKRSVQFWDYEHMVLEAFSNIFKVKCLSNTDPNSETEAGSLTLIVVSDLRNKDSSNPFEPSTSILILEEVKEFISQFISPFVTVFVEQPLYETMLVDAKIGFILGFDPGFYSNRLNEELKQFLSPWAFAEGIDIEIGGAIYKSSILHFIETREYVDFVVDFKLYHKQGGFFEVGIAEMEIDLDFEVAPSLEIEGIGDMAIGINYIVGKDVVIACATSSRSILVSAINHRITALRPEEYVCPGTSSLGIGFMTVNLDLVVGE